MYGNGMLQGKSFRIPCVALSDIFRQNKIDYIDLLKIDAEGVEYDILLGAEKGLLRKIKRIILEYHDFYNHGHMYQEIVDKLQLSGFKCLVKHPFPGQKTFIKSGVIEAINMGDQNGYSGFRGGR